MADCSPPRKKLKSDNVSVEEQLRSELASKNRELEKVTKDMIAAFNSGSPRTALWNKFSSILRKEKSCVLTAINSGEIRTADQVPAELADDRGFWDEVGESAAYWRALSSPDRPGESVLDRFPPLAASTSFWCHVFKRCAHEYQEFPVVRSFLRHFHSKLRLRKDIGLLHAVYRFVSLGFTQIVFRASFRVNEDRFLASLDIEPETLLQDHKRLSNLIYDSKGKVLNLIPPRQHFSIMSLLCKVVVPVQEYISPELWKDRSFVLMWIKKAPYAIKDRLIEDFRRDKGFWLEAASAARYGVVKDLFAACPFLQDDDLMRRVIFAQPYLYDLGSQALRSDKELTIFVLRRESHLFFGNHVPKPLSDDFDVKLCAVACRSYPPPRQCRTFEDIKLRVRTKLEAHSRFVNDFLPGFGMVEGQNSPLSILQQDKATTASLKHRIAEFLDAPTTARELSWLRCVKIKYPAYFD